MGALYPFFTIDIANRLSLEMLEPLRDMASDSGTGEGKMKHPEGSRNVLPEKQKEYQVKHFLDFDIALSITNLLIEESASLYYLI